MTWELVPDQGFLVPSLWIYAMILKFWLLEWSALLIMFLGINLNSFFYLLILLSDDISLDPEPTNHHKIHAWTNLIFLNQGVYTLSISTSIVCCR